MQKIMFSDRFGLTQAVLEGRKTNTRRIIDAPSSAIYMEPVLDLCGNIIKVYAFDPDFRRIGVFSPKYRVGEVVSNFGWSKDYGTISYIGADGVLHNYSGRAEDWEVLDESETDWAAYRREAAKDILCAILRSNQTDDNDKPFRTFEDLAKGSVACADALIAKLQEK